MGLISQSHTFLFVHIPKTGGTSVNSILRPYGRSFNTIEGLHHFILTRHFDWSQRLRSVEHTAAPVLKDFFGEAVWKNFQTFSIVRNPWARIVSLHAYILKRNQHFLYPVAQALSFDEFVEYLVQTRFVSQSEFLSDNHGNFIVDKILKTEDLNKEGDQFFSNLLKQPVILPMENKTEHKHFSEICSPRSKDLIASAFKLDIEQFEYEYSY